MRKIIITVIATIFMIAPFEKAKGQGWRPPQTVITSADFPTVNILTGATGKLSLGLWRFEPFFQAGQFFQVFEEQMTIETTIWPWDGTPSFIRQNEFHSQRFLGQTMLDLGIKFRITDRNRIKLGLVGIMDASRSGWEHYYWGYVHKVNLSQRINLDLSVRFSFFDGGRGIVNITERREHYNAENYSASYQSISFGTRLNYEILRNLKLNVQLGYTRRHSVTDGWHTSGYAEGLYTENTSGERLFTRNLMYFSIGIHYHIQFGGRQQQVAHRQRVAPSRRPTHRVAPSTFNHPTLPPRTR